MSLILWDSFDDDGNVVTVVLQAERLDGSFIDTVRVDGRSADHVRFAGQYVDGLRLEGRVV